MLNEQNLWLFMAIFRILRLNRQAMKYQNLFLYLWLILVAMSLSNCAYYKRVENFRDDNSDVDEKLILKQVYKSLDEKSYLVLRYNSDLWHLSDVALSDDRRTVSASREVVSENHYAVFQKITSKKSIPYLPDEKPYIHQTHLFVKNFDFDEENNIVSIPIDNILKFEIYKPNYTNTGLLIASVVTVVTTLVVVGVRLTGEATVTANCNCPYVYSESESQLVFEGSLFPGSIYPSLERVDYIPLSNRPLANALLKLTVKNEKKEILNINQLSLLTVEHEPGVKVLIDQAGNPQTISNPMLPVRSASYKRYDHTKDLIDADGIAYYFADPEINPFTKMSELDLVFGRTADASKGKLILRVKNDNWGGFIYEEVSTMLGKRFERYHSKEENRSRKEVKELMRKEGFLMSVSIYQNGLWQPIDYIWPTGSKAYKEVVVPIDLRNLDDDEIRIKLEGGFKFWNIDQAAIDFSEDLELQVYESFAEPRDVNGENEFVSALRYDDDIYMNHLQQGEMIDLQYRVGEQEEESTYSYFLKGKGFYIVDKEYDSRMRIGELLRFRREGGFSYYSFRRYNEIAERLSLSE